MPVAIYVRVSTEEQRERQSILTQREFAERYCGLHELPIFRIYSDDGISGRVPDRRLSGQILRSSCRQIRQLFYRWIALAAKPN